MKVEICRLDRNRNLDKINVNWLVQAIDSFSRIPITQIESFELGKASDTFSYYALAAEYKNNTFSTQYFFDTNILIKENRTELNKIIAKNSKRGGGDSDDETPGANKNPATLASMCRNIGLLEDYHNSIRLTPFALQLFKYNKVLVEEYVFALLAKQWIKVEGECKRPLLCVIFDLCEESDIFLQKLKETSNEAASLIAQKVVGDGEEIELERAKMDILKNHLLLSGLFTSNHDKDIILTYNGKEILKSFREKEYSIPKYSNEDFNKYMGEVENGAFSAIDSNNALIFKSLYPNLVSIFLKLKKDKTEINTSCEITPIILYGPPGTGKTHEMQTEYMPKFTKDNIFVTTFHQSYSYEDFVEGLKPILDESNEDVKYHIETGIFYNACKRAAILAGYDSLKDCIADTRESREAIFNKAIDSKKTVLLCIDEINRGNVASIFGDLISLIEPSKRLGAGPYEMTAILPYSKTKFGVPANLFIVGTMNTADRSIQLLDSALRRRFKFEELSPNPEKISNKNARKVFEGINDRIRCLLNKDNQIGHSYLMNAQSNKDIVDALINRIIPLLEEYFYNEIDKVRFVLNESKAKDYTFYVKDDEAQKAYENYLSIEEIDGEGKKFYKLNDEIAKSTSDEEYGRYLKHLLGNEELDVVKLADNE